MIEALRNFGGENAPALPTGTDPFTLVYNGFWSLIEAEPYFDVNLKERNRIKYAVLNDRDPAKREHSTSDMPQLELLQENATSNLHADSNGSRITLQYIWVINTGEQTISLVNAMQWHLIKCLSRWRHLLTTLEWEGKRFVKKCDVTGGTMGLSNPRANNNIRGQTAVWTCSVEMIFESNLLQAGV